MCLKPGMSGAVYVSALHSHLLLESDEVEVSEKLSGSLMLRADNEMALRRDYLQHCSNSINLSLLSCESALGKQAQKINFMLSHWCKHALQKAGWRTRFGRKLCF